MVSNRVILRLGHILEAITRAKTLLAGKSHADLLEKSCVIGSLEDYAEWVKRYGTT